jgi:hypothetical protein
MRLERLREPPQKRQVALEDPLADVDRPAVERADLGLEVEERVALVANRAPARRAARQVEDRLAAALADALDEPGVRGAVLRGRAVLLARAWRWITAAPASAAATASSTIASGVSGRFGCGRRPGRPNR